MDLNDGCLEEQYKCYQDRLQKVTNLKLVDREDLQSKFNLHLTQLKEDLEFLNTGMQRSYHA